MYARLDNGWIKLEFIIGVEQFVEFAQKCIQNVWAVKR